MRKIACCAFGRIVAFQLQFRNETESKKKGVYRLAIRAVESAALCFVILSLGTKEVTSAHKNGFLGLKLNN